jgi:hypothetical protein
MKENSATDWGQEKQAEINEWLSSVFNCCQYLDYTHNVLDIIEVVPLRLHHLSEINVLNISSHIHIT